MRGKVNGVGLSDETKIKVTKHLLNAIQLIYEDNILAARKEINRANLVTEKDVMNRILEQIRHWGKR